MKRKLNSNFFLKNLRLKTRDAGVRAATPNRVTQCVCPCVCVYVCVCVRVLRVFYSGLPMMKKYHHTDLHEREIFHRNQTFD